MVTDGGQHSPGLLRLLHQPLSKIHSFLMIMGEKSESGTVWQHVQQKLCNVFAVESAFCVNNFSPSLITNRMTNRILLMPQTSQPKYQFGSLGLGNNLSVTAAFHHSLWLAFTDLKDLFAGEPLNAQYNALCSVFAV